MIWLQLLNLLGLGDQAVKEATDRVESALIDLPILMGLLIESGQLKVNTNFLENTVFLGEVGLGGELNHFKGVLPMIIEAKRKNIKRIVLPKDNLEEAKIVKDIDIFAFSSLKDVLGWIKNEAKYIEPQVKSQEVTENAFLDFADVIGHNHLMKYIIAAASGNHNMLLIGPPGCGKSMIAKRFPSILPKMSQEEALEVMAIHSVTGKDVSNILSGIRPFRSPHYNTSSNAIIGGGANAMPGEISLAHNGVLFLDELPEYSRQTIDSLRQPLEDRCVTVARVRSTNTFPANFMLIAAMNPCKCGHYGTGVCRCTDREVLKYRHKISGPIYDRLDIQKYLNKVDVFATDKDYEKYSSTQMKEIVLRTRKIQQKRFEGNSFIRFNSQMESSDISKYCKLDSESYDVLVKYFTQFGFSARSKNKVISLARTFADVDQSEKIEKEHIHSALLGRDLDKDI